MSPERTFLNEVETGDVVVLDLSVKVNPVLPDPNGKSLVAVNVGCSSPEYSTIEDQSRRRLVLTFTLEAKMTDDTPDGGEERLSARTTIGVVAHCAECERSTDELQDLLERDALVTAYSTARTLIAQVTKMSPLGGFSIPNADPDLLLASVRENRDEIVTI